MNRSDLDVLNRDFYNVFFKSTPLRENSTGGCESYTYEDTTIRLIDADYICFYKYLLSLHQRISEYDHEQKIKVEHKFLNNNI